MSMLGQRTPAERAAINARAAAWRRPLSAHQHQALARMAKYGRLVRGRAGWGAPGELLEFWQTTTITALTKRGLAKIEHRRFARITAAGRRYLRGHPA
jgi:hypothetical protein